MESSAFKRLLKATPDKYKRENMQLMPQWMSDQELYAELTGGVGQDYDYGMMQKRDDRGHSTDKGKLPWHPTFSNQSAFTSKGSPGGQWENVEGRETYTPDFTQLSNQSPKELLKYMDEVEPDTMLMKHKNVPPQEESGLFDVSGLVVPHAMYGSAFKNPWFGPTMKKAIPDFEFIKSGRKMKGALRDKGLMAGSALAIGDEISE